MSVLNRLRKQVQHLYLLRKYSNRIDLVSLLASLGSFKYVVLKSDVPYAPSRFPEEYPVGKDLDLLVSDSDFDRAVATIEAFVASTKWGRPVVLHREPGRVMLRFNFWFDILHYLIDCSAASTLGELGDELLVERELGIFPTPSRSRELLFRANEYLDNPRKSHHLEYILRYSSEWDQPLAQRCHIALTDGVVSRF
tara:strand:- start:177 stop:764 length:588 start_codon:yes stop_codon:yes gene_type:complete